MSTRTDPTSRVLEASTYALGVDFGGSSIKGAPVALVDGELTAPAVALATPRPATPSAVAETIVELLAHFDRPPGAVGVALPAVVRRGEVRSAANIDSSWIGVDAEALFSAATGGVVRVVNDADAAGVAEATFGAARDRDGLTIVTTLGTGIGSALIYNGELVPNSELGHLTIEGHDAEKWAASSVKVQHHLSYASWADRLTVYYRTLEQLFSPDLIVIGGGVSTDASQFLHLIDVQTEIVAAALQNRAGLIGAAYLASRSAARLSATG
jgi:polyphosphate glucokinase